MNILESNKLIAHFLGYYMEDGYLHTEEGWACDYAITYEDLDYHKSFDQLIPALDIIENSYHWELYNVGIGIYEFSIAQSWRDLDDADNFGLPDGFMIRSDERASDFKDQRIEAVYRGIVHFIQWYNDNEIEISSI